MDKADEFIFPIKRDQLFEKPSDERFWFNEDSLYENTIENNQSLLNDIAKSPLIIISKPVFVSLFSLFRDKDSQSIEDKNQYTQKLLEGFYAFTANLEKDIDTIKQNKDSSYEYRNALKIYAFFITWIIEQYSETQTDKEKLIKTPKKRHKGKKVYHHNSSSKKILNKDNTKPKSKSKSKPQTKKETKRKSSMNSDSNININPSNQLTVNISFLLKSLTKLTQIKIEVIFLNKIIENELLSCIISSMFLLLKINPSQSHPSPITPKEKETIFFILNTIITQYQSYTNIYIILQNLSTSIIELIYNNESLITNLTEFLYVGITNDIKLQSFTNEIIGELIIIINKDSKYESQGMRNIATFLISLESKLPKLIYNSMPILIKLYNSKSYFIRNAIGEMIGGIIIDCLCKNVDSIDSVDLRNEYYKAKQTFIDILFKRLYDENCFSRNKVLQVFERLCDTNSLGIDDYLELMKETTIRIKDERAQVRKRAIELLEKIIMLFASVFKCNNHFAEIKQLDEEIKTSRLKIEEIKQLIHKDDDNNKSKDNEGMVIEVKNKDKEKEEENSNQVKENGDDDHKEELFNQLNQEEAMIEYYNKYRTVITSINSTIPYIIDLLYSKSISDVIQSISLLKTLNQLNISEAFKGIQKMLSLILSSESTIQRKVKETIVAIYFNSTIPLLTQLNSIMALMNNLNRSGLSCFGLIIQSLIEEHMISLKIIKELYIRIVKTNDSNEDKNCLLFIVRAAECDKRVIVNNADVYLKILEQRLLKEIIEWEWLKESIHGLIIIQMNMKEKEKDVDNVMKKIIRAMIIKGIIDRNNTTEEYEDEWFSSAQEIINVIFEIYPNPDTIANNIMIILIKKLHENKVPKMDIDIPIEESLIKEEKDKKDENNNNDLLIQITKLIFLIGHISLNMINYIDKIQSHIKQENHNLKEEKHEKEKQYEARQEYAIDLIQNLFDSQYITSSSFKPYLDLINSITSRLLHCPHHELESNSLLYKSALLTQCKLMCINSTYCTNTLPFIIQILTSDIIPPMFKLNMIVSLGDLINRYPNILQSSLPSIFTCLKENNSIIRRYIVTVISHLVLNDMLKLKGEIVDICLLLETDDHRLKDNILFLLSKISHKGSSIIYNILPKALVKLNEYYKELPYDMTQRVIKMLVKYIDQDKQVENLLEKMFVKLKNSVCEIEWRNVSYCLSLLNYTERHAIKFLELYSVIRERIKYNDVIEENFGNVLNKIKRGKNKDEVELLEKKMLLGKKVVGEKKKRKRNENKTKSKSDSNKVKVNGKSTSKPKAKPRKKSYEESDEDEDESIPLEEDEDEDDDDDDDDDNDYNNNEDIEMNE